MPVVSRRITGAKRLPGGVVAKGAMSAASRRYLKRRNDDGTPSKPTTYRIPVMIKKIPTNEMTMFFQDCGTGIKKKSKPTRPCLTSIVSVGGCDVITYLLNNECDRSACARRVRRPLYTYALPTGPLKFSRDPRRIRSPSIFVPHGCSVAFYTPSRTKVVVSFMWFVQIKRVDDNIRDTSSKPTTYRIPVTIKQIPTNEMMTFFENCGDRNHF